MAIEIVSFQVFPLNMVIFHSFLYVYQRVAKFGCPHLHDSGRFQVSELFEFIHIIADCLI